MLNGHGTRVRVKFEDTTTKYFMNLGDVQAAQLGKLRQAGGHFPVFRAERSGGQVFTISAQRLRQLVPQVVVMPKPIAASM